MSLCNTTKCNVPCATYSLAVRHSCRVSTKLITNNDAYFHKVCLRRRVHYCHRVWLQLHHSIYVSTWAFHLCKQTTVTQQRHNRKNMRNKSKKINRQVMKIKLIILLQLSLMAIQILQINTRMIWKVEKVARRCTLSICVHLTRSFKQHCSRHWCSEPKHMLVLSEWLRSHHLKSYFKKSM